MGERIGGWEVTVAEELIARRKQERQIMVVVVVRELGVDSGASRWNFLTLYGSELGQ